MLWLLPMKLSTASGDLEAHARSKVFQQSFHLRYSYPVHFTHGLFTRENDILDGVLVAGHPGERARVLVVLDEGLVSHHPDLAEQIAERAQVAFGWQLVGAPLLLPGGEAAKNRLEHIERIYQAVEARALDRHSYILALGGGAVLDAVGYAAATSHRGIRLVRVPTTVLGQNDSGVGVKNSINYFGLKNFLGTFAPPWAVLNDFDFLRTLSRRDAVSGMAEAIKVALIKDAEFFDWLCRHVSELARCDSDAVEQLIERTAILHLRHISSSGDPFESGSSRPLDFGHWVAHKLESLTSHELRHGEAVAIGIALDSLYSVELGLLDAGAGERIIALIKGLGLPIYHPALEERSSDGAPSYLDGLEEFRQHLGGMLSVTLLKELGEGVQVHEMDVARLERCRARMAQLASNQL